MALYLLLLVASISLCVSAQALNCTSGYDWWCEECSSGGCAANGCKHYGKSCPSLPSTNLGGWNPDNSSAEQGCCVACAEPLWKIDSPESVVGDKVIPGVWSDILGKGEQAEYNTIGPNFEMEFQITFNSLSSGWNSYIRLIAKKNGAFVDTTGYPGRVVSGWQTSGNNGNKMSFCFSPGANLGKCADVENIQVGTPVKVKLVLANSTNHTAYYYADDVLLRTEQLEDNHPTSPDYVGQYPISQTYLRLADSYHGIADATVNNFLAINKPGAEDSYPLCSAPVRATCGDADGIGSAKVAVTCPSGYLMKANTMDSHCVGKTCDTSAASLTDTATCCEVITTTITTTSISTMTATSITETTLTTTTLTATASSTTATTTITSSTVSSTTLTTTSVSKTSTATTTATTASSTTATTTITSSTVSSTTLTTTSVSKTSTATTTATTASVSRTTVTTTTASATKTSTSVTSTSLTLVSEDADLSLSTTHSAHVAILFVVMIWQTAGSLHG